MKELEDYFKKIEKRERIPTKKSFYKRFPHNAKYETARLGLPPSSLSNPSFHISKLGILCMLI
ncbi:hypothetical protein [Aquifex sp.]